MMIAVTIAAYLCGLVTAYPLIGYQRSYIGQIEYERLENMRMLKAAEDIVGNISTHAECVH